MRSALLICLLALTACASRPDETSVSETGPDLVEFSARATTQAARGWGDDMLTYDIELSRDGRYRIAIADDPAPVPQDGPEPWATTRFGYSAGVADSLAEAVWALLPSAELSEVLPPRPPGGGETVGAVVTNGRRRYLTGGSAQEVRRLLMRSPSFVSVEPTDSFSVGTRSGAWPPPVPTAL